MCRLLRPAGRQVIPKRVVTEGSVWVFDLAGRYMRMPRHEGPRQNGWGNEDAGILQDLVWHEFNGIEVVDRIGMPCLRIMTPTSERYGIVTGPIVEGLDEARWLSEPWPCDEPGYWPRWNFEDVA